MKAFLTPFAGLVFAAPVVAAPPTPGGVHVRGTVKSLAGGVLTVQTASGPVVVQLAAKTPVVSVVPSSRAAIKDGSFLGIASVPGTSGSQIAREVVVFPEAARGTGEGSYPWDLPGAGGTKTPSKMTNSTAHRSTMTNGSAMRSKMTNGTAKSSGGDTITLSYKSGTGTGTQTIRLTPGIPVVTFGPGTMAGLTPGAHVVAFCHAAGGKTVADRVLVGKGGLTPPM